MKKIILSTVCAGLLSVSAMADTFDGSRQGFMLGLGIGVTSVSTEIDFNGGIHADERASGLATSFKIGYGFNEQFSLYYTNQVDWYTFDGSSTSVGLTGIGANFYIDSNALFYGTAMLGFGVISEINNNDASTGSAFEVGVGYDVAPHMSVEASYLHVNIDENYADINTDSLRVKFLYTWY